MLLACCAAGGYPEQLDAGGAALEGTKSLLCQESCCMCWRQMTSSVCLRADLASYLSCEKDASNERCFLHLVMAFSEMLLWEWNFVCLVLHHEGAHVCPCAVGRQHREHGCVTVQGGLVACTRLSRWLKGSRRWGWQFCELLPCLFSLMSEIVIHIQRECKVMAENPKRLKGQAIPQTNSPGSTTILNVLAVPCKA